MRFLISNLEMGLTGRLVWVNSYSKKQCRSLFWRMRAAMKKAAAKSGQKLKFQYDPSSYALNFDDGFGERNRSFQPPKFLEECSNTATTWVYVIWVESQIRLYDVETFIMCIVLGIYNFGFVNCESVHCFICRCGRAGENCCIK